MDNHDNNWIYVLIGVIITIFLVLLALCYFYPHTNTVLRTFAAASEVEISEADSPADDTTEETTEMFATVGDVELLEKEQAELKDQLESAISDWQDFYQQEVIARFDTLLQSQQDLLTAVYDINVSGNAQKEEQIIVQDYSDLSRLQSDKDVTTHVFLSVDSQYTESDLLIKIYNLLLLIFVFMILRFLYQEAKSLFARFVPRS